MEFPSAFLCRMSSNILCNLSIAVVALAACPLPLLQAQCVHDYRSGKKGGIVVEHIALSGTQTLSSDEIAAITSAMTGTCMDDDSGAVAEVIRDQFQQRGYFSAKVEDSQIEVDDPLAMPKPVDVEAQVKEGPLYRLAELELANYRAFSSDQLRAQFPVKLGDVFSTEKVRSGLDALRRLYVSQGYLDFTCVPSTEPLPEYAVRLKIEIQEGRQYRMGKLQIAGAPEVAEDLETRWSLLPGAVFDGTYPEKFVKDNRDILPAGFNPYASVRWIRDCRDNTVNVAIYLDKNSIPLQPAKEDDCDSAAKAHNVAHP
jgi:outer membrane protein assembly factor BamA